MLGVFPSTDIQRSALQPAAPPCSGLSAVMFIVMAVADKCMIRIHYLWAYGDEAMKSLRLNAPAFITVSVAVQMPDE